MKRIYTILALAVLLAMGVGKAYAQVVDVCAGNDIVELHLGNYQYGLVQWQVSDDNEFWMDIDGAIDTVYRFMPERARYYRAKVRFPNCAQNDYLSQVSYVQVPPMAKAGVDFAIPAGTVYRLRGNAIDAAVGQWNVIEGEGFELQDPNDPNSGFIGEEGTYKLTWTLTNSCGSSTDTVTLTCMKIEYNSNLVVVDETDEILSDSTMLVNGDYVIRFADPVPNIDTASILIGYREDSFLRRVVSFEKEGDVFYLKTEQGYLSDVIKSGAFCFNILPSEPGGKSSSVKYLDHYPTRKELAEDPFLLRDGNIYVIRSVRDNEDGKDEDLEITILIEDGSIQLGADVDMGLLDHELDGLRYEHTISLTPSFDADLAFDGSGHLSRFYMGFYDAQFEVTRRFHIDREMTSVGFKKSGKFNKKPKIVTGFFVGSVPVIVKLDWPYSLELSLALNGLEMTSTRTTTFTCAVEYNPAFDTFEEILEKSEPVETVEWGDLNGTLEMEFKAGPKFTFIVAGVFGPYVKATGKIAPSLCVSTQPPFDISTRVRFGLDLTLGCKFQLFTEFFSAELSWPFHIIDRTESSPKSVLKRGGDNQVYSFGNYLPQPISVDVKGLFGMNMKLANVHFEPQNGGEVSRSIVVSGLDGVASTLWKPGLSYGHDRLKVRVFDCEGNPVDGTPLTFHAYSSATDPCIESTLAVEAYHVNENSIIPLVTGGVPPYLYSLDDEAYSVQQPTIVTSPGQSYTFYVRDAIGCEAMTTCNVPVHDCTNTSLRLSANVVGNSINAVAMFGFPPYKFSIDGVNYQHLGTFTQLLDGDYTVYVRDFLGCEDSKQVTVNQLGHIYLEISNIENNQGTAYAYPIDYETLHDKGVCWSTHHEPTVDDFTASYGPGTGRFPFEITSFEPNVEYYVRAYALDSSGTSYSREVVAQSQQGITEPYVIATKIEDVTLTSAIGTGCVFWDGGAEVTERGICWGLNHNPTINDFHASSGEGMGRFSVEITDLTPHATYYARAYAINRIGVAYASEVDFVAQPGGNLHIPQGAVSGRFTIGNEQQVFFSQGNLQYQASTNTWRFAENQWDCVGESNSNISPTNTGWIDLFGWGTSGYNHGAVCYQPWSTSGTTSDYYAYGNGSYDLGDQSGKADWGYNAISNGGGTTNSWRTLTLDEWRNLLYFRETSSGIRFAMAKVNNVNGVLLLPDDWHSNTYSLNNPNDNYGSFTDNVISASQWGALETAGAVFIPAAGRRVETSVSSIGSYGSYWTSSHYLNDYATDVNFIDTYLGPGANNSHNPPRNEGCSVRLVSEGVSGPSGQLPQVTTMAVTGVTSSSATCGGIVMLDGGSTVTERGVCWSTDHNPTVGVGHASAGSGTGAFTVSATGLVAGTTYYVRAYATNSVGTAYGNEVEFFTGDGGGTVVPTGAIDGLFSVAPGYKVYFSQGNLQYQPSTSTWRFAENQFDLLHSINEMVQYDENMGAYYCDVTNEYNSYYSGWIDMFGWGTSGYNHGAVCYQPWSVSQNDADYMAYGNVTNSLNDQTGQADWGYNAISNGGNQQCQWRTLNGGEWVFLLDCRNTGSGVRFAKAKVGGVDGVIVLPDNWQVSTFSLNNVNQKDAGFSSNNIGLSSWMVLEEAGAVFLPASGARIGTKLYNKAVDEHDPMEESTLGEYWSSSIFPGFVDEHYPSNLSFAEEWIRPRDNFYRSFGCGVRLVHEGQGTQLQGYSPWEFGPTGGGTGPGSITTESYTFLGLPYYGSCPILEKGACWSLSPNPTLADNHIAGEEGTEYVRGTIHGLTPNTTYYLRMFVSDSLYTYYSEEIVFTTLPDGGGGNDMPEGAINGVFSVGEGRQVCFSKGNLQYQASTNTWRFAENQWDYVGDATSGSVYENGVKCNNDFISPTYSGWIDLFGWGTSGYNHGAVCYQPWSQSQNNSDYYAYGNADYDLNDSNGQADWGFNAIVGGGNQTNNWRTLTDSEWEYVLNGRTTQSGMRFVFANVNDVNGLILLPDDWDESIYPFVLVNEPANFINNVINAASWSLLETNGAVFLPPNGTRYPTYLEGTGYDHQGQYWSASKSDAQIVRVMGFGRFGNPHIHYICNPHSAFFRYDGIGVRLVHDIASNPSSGQLPQVTTSEVSVFYNDAAECGGNVISDGGFAVTERGVCWSTGQNPTISGNHASSGSGTGSFVVNATGIVEGVTYYARAYAINAVGVAYGNEVSFMKHQGGGGGGGTGGECPEGGIDGLFTINEAGDMVYFSQGNLQYQASTNTWRFAEHQWDYVGEGNNNISPNYNGWIDLFGWGTSGYEHGAVCYQPWSTDMGYTSYFAYGNPEYNLYDQTGQADWGYNPISNGENQEELWRVLTQSEWNYVLDTRNTISGIRYAKACVNGVNGLILVSDQWDGDNYTLVAPDIMWAPFDSNIITLTTWESQFENSGCVFLPASGLRMGVSTSNATENGIYWSATCYSIYYANYIDIYGVEPCPMVHSNRYYGLAVRLVYDAGSGSGSGGGGGHK